MLIVTTSQRPAKEHILLARRLASQLKAPLVKRDRSIAQLLKVHKAAEAVVVSGAGVRWVTAEGEPFFFHPNMSAVRVRQLRKGGEDSFLQAAQLRPGDHVLDCTLGLGADAIVAAFAVGVEGRVLGLESQPVIAALVEHGLQTYEVDTPVLKEAMKRVEVRCVDYRDFLPRCPDDAFDVVYFDPMFRHTVKRSSAMQSLRRLANMAPVDEAMVREARRVARRRVVLKERPSSGEFARLGFQVVKEASSFAFGVIEKGGEGT
ncbi:hypothetical protein GCM10011571_28540 [Marinithermofilum abyssi]|uniref:SAM-dependent methyltransferase n=1 Tax=Marinithermofilum abyssi TaxID=1571185 RepID=A0A8J2VIT3_9BACL|nr:class I SAM-dependent methyltransferase [Marinithermofilum abyssi]GGE24697.1 hypothetical protein GCM10011571_28540 [Marinithermofilum abyssi]